MHFALTQVAPSLRYDRQTVEGVCLGSDCPNALGVRETPLVTQIRRFGLPLFPVDGSLPAQDVGEKRVIALLREKRDRVVEQGERLLRVAGPLSHLCPFNELASLVQSASPVIPARASTLPRSECSARSGSGTRREFQRRWRSPENTSLPRPARLGLRSRPVRSPRSHRGDMQSECRCLRKFHRRKYVAAAARR